MDDIESKLLSPEFVKTVYTDAASATVQELSKIGVDVAKTIRLVFFPLQYTAAFQDRLAAYIDQSVRKVPEQRRIAPRESMILPIADKLRYQEENSPISELYVNLLARAMDRDRVGEAHPAFLNIISQLAPDEILVIEQLQSLDHRVFFRLDKKHITVLKSESDQAVEKFGISDALKADLLNRSVSPESLAQPELFLTFLEHLISLGLVEYTNQPWHEKEEWKKAGGNHQGNTEFWAIALTKFGRLFYSACVSGS